MPDDPASRTLAILLGASKFPEYPALLKGQFFEDSANDLKNYLTDPLGLALPPENVLSLFNSNHAASKQIVKIGDFLLSRRQQFQREGSEDENLIIYYVGHGLPDGPALCLAVRSTDVHHEGATSLRVRDLARCVTDHAIFMKRIIILDCCYAASAVKEFQGGAEAHARVQIFEEFPKKGTTLLCASNSTDPALAPEGLGRTMFTFGLIHALRNGHKACGERLSLRDVCDVTRDYLITRFPEKAVRPEVHSPDQREGDVARIRLFPNPAFSKAKVVRLPVKTVLPPAARKIPAAAIAEARSRSLPKANLPAEKKVFAERLKTAKTRVEADGERDAEEKKREAQEAAAERVLRETRRIRAERAERARLAKERKADNGALRLPEQQPAIPAKDPFAEFVTKGKRDFAVEPAEFGKSGPIAEQTPEKPLAFPVDRTPEKSLVFPIVVVILANGLGFFAGEYLASSTQGLRFLDSLGAVARFAALSVLYGVGALVIMVIGAAQFSPRTKYTLALMWPGFSIGYYFVDRHFTHPPYSVWLTLAGLALGFLVASAISRRK